MVAIVTDPLKQLVADLVKLNDSDASNKYYAAIGRSEQWNATDTPPTPQRSLAEEIDFRNSMQSVKLIGDVSRVIPRANWTSGSVYDAYDDAQVGYPTNTFYVLNNNQQVYMCLRQGKSATGVVQVSTVEPTGGTNGTPFRGTDGYVWKFMYSISSLDASKFQSANFIPVKLVEGIDTNSPVSDQEQKGVQDAAIKGQVVGYEVVVAGQYTGTPTLTIEGDGTGANATAVMNNNQIVDVKVTDSSDNTFKLANMGQNYNYASVKISGGGSVSEIAQIRPILSPPMGLGHDPTDDLKSSSLMFNAKPSGEESLDFIIGQDFRQVGLLKNPKVDSSGNVFRQLMVQGRHYSGDSDSGGGTLFTASTGRAVRGLQMASVSANFTEDKTIVGGTSGAKAIVDKDSGSGSGTALFYHQNDSTGFANFIAGEALTESDGTGGGNIEASSGYDSGTAAFIKAEVNPFTGDLLYIDNRAAITRSAEQTEDIKIVIQV